MKKKTLLFVIFTFLIVFNMISLYTYADTNYSFGIPEQSVGVPSEYEVMVSEEDEWEDCIGKTIDAGDLFTGHAEDVGAKLKTEITKLKKDDDINSASELYIAPFFNILHENFRQLLPTFSLNYSAAMPVYGPFGPFGFIANYSLWNASTWTSTAYQTYAARNASLIAQGAFNSFLSSFPEFWSFANYYSTEIKGSIIVRDVWYFKDKHDDKPDDNVETPFLADPHDWSDSYLRMEAYAYALYNIFDNIQEYWGSRNPSNPGWWFYLADKCAHDTPRNFEAYEKMNSTIYEQIMKIQDITTRMTMLSLIGPPASNVTALLGLEGPGDEYQQDYVLGLYRMGDQILETFKATILAVLPDKFGFFFYQLLRGDGLYVPSDKYLEEVVEEYDFNDEKLYRMLLINFGKDFDGDGTIGIVPVGSVSPNTGLPLLGAETLYVYAYVDISAENGILTIEIEYLDDQIDPIDALIFGGDGKDELSDWTWIHIFNEYGSPVEWKFKHDDTVFYNVVFLDPMKPIITIAIISIISIVGLIGVIIIYIIIKKRKKD
ncbi:MAG: hypothetical protein ACFFDH_15885 [Promethearchaeota archaeon]